MKPAVKSRRPTPQTAAVQLRFALFCCQEQTGYQDYCFWTSAQNPELMFRTTASGCILKLDALTPSPSIQNMQLIKHSTHPATNTPPLPLLIQSWQPQLRSSPR